MRSSSLTKKYQKILAILVAGLIPTVGFAGTDYNTTGGLNDYANEGRPQLIGDDTLTVEATLNHNNADAAHTATIGTGADIKVFVNDFGVLSRTVNATAAAIGTNGDRSSGDKVTVTLTGEGKVKNNETNGLAIKLDQVGDIVNMQVDSSITGNVELAGTLTHGSTGTFAGNIVGTETSTVEHSNTGQITGTVTAKNITKSGTGEVGGLVTVTAGGELTNTSTGIDHGVTITDGKINNNAGIIAGQVTVNDAEGEINSSGTARFTGTVEVNAGTLNNTSTHASSYNGITVTTGEVNNNAGIIADQVTVNDAEGKVNSSGTARFTGTVEVKAGTLNNTSTHTNSFNGITVTTG